MLIFLGSIQQVSIKCRELYQPHGSYWENSSPRSGPSLSLVMVMCRKVKWPTNATTQHELPCEAVYLNHQYGGMIYLTFNSTPKWPKPKSSLPTIMFLNSLLNFGSVHHIFFLCLYKMFLFDLRDYWAKRCILFFIVLKGDILNIRIAFIQIFFTLKLSGKWWFPILTTGKLIVFGKRCGNKKTNPPPTRWAPFQL